MHDAMHLVRTRRFLPIFVTQFLGAFNDNLFRTAMVLLVIYGIYRDAEQAAALRATAGGRPASPPPRRRLSVPPLEGPAGHLRHLWRCRAGGSLQRHRRGPVHRAL